MPRISVVMSVYNAQSYLVSTIPSILDQTFSDFEFIIIDDCSTDKSLEIIKRYREQDSRIVLLENPENVGLTRSLNWGLNIAKGKYIARMDSDDISLPDRLRKQYEYLENNPAIFLVGSSAYIIDEQGQNIGLKEITLNPVKIEKRLMKTNCLIHPTIMFRNDGKIRYREKALFCEDYDFFLQLLCQGKKLDNIKEPLIKYRLTVNSISAEKYFHAKLFLEKMKQISLYEAKTGTNLYDAFDPKEVLKIPPPKISSVYADERYISLLFEFGNTKLLRNKSLAYIRKNGVFNKALIYYLLSFIPKLLKK